MAQATPRVQMHPTLPFPSIDQIFKLTARTKITPLGLVRDFGYPTTKGWKSSATSIPAGSIDHFTLIDVNRHQYPEDRTTNGCWLKVFLETFGPSDHRPIGVADLSWVNPRGWEVFPRCEARGLKGFDWAPSFRSDGFGWLWLVKAKKKHLPLR